MACDFSIYTSLRDDTRNKATRAQASCAGVETATAAVGDAQAALDAAQLEKTDAYDEWQKAERAENAEATKLGIDPIPPTPTP